MWTLLATAAVSLAGGQTSSFLPPDCVRAVPAGTHNGRLLVSPRGKPGLWLAAASGKLERQLTHGRDGEASFSQSGRKIVFHRTTRRGRDAIVTRDMSSGRTRTIFTSAAGENFAQVPLWSPDGRWITFLNETSTGTGDDERSKTEVTMIRPDGTGAHAVGVVSNLTNIPTLAWSPNGRCLAYQWGNFTAGTLAIRNADFSQGVNLVPFNVVMPDGDKIFLPTSAAFGADGRRLYASFIMSKKDAGDRIYSIAMDRPAPPRAVVNHAMYPVSSPDGRLLAYYSFDDRSTHVRKVSGPPQDRRLLNGVVWDWAPTR